MISDNITIYWDNDKLKALGGVDYPSQASVCRDWAEFHFYHDDIVGMQGVIEFKDNVILRYSLDDVENIIQEHLKALEVERNEDERRFS